MTEYPDVTAAVSAETLDEVLSSYQPFGDSDYIHEQMHVSYCRRLRNIAASLPSAGHLAEELSEIDGLLARRVLGDTVVRCATQHAYRQVLTAAPYGLAFKTCDEIFTRTTDLIRSGMRCGPLESSVTQAQHIGSVESYGWLWTEDHPDDVFGTAFRQLISQNYGEALSSPRDADIAMIQEAVSLLEELLPSITASALSHAHVVALFEPAGNWAGRASGSQFRLGGTIFLNRDALRNPWWVAEHLLHESLHQKLYDFRHGHSLLAQDLLPLEQLLALEDETALPETRKSGVWSPWNTPGTTELNVWDTHRVLAAYHVYVHLSLLSGQACRRASSLARRYGALDEHPPLMTDPRTALDRAHYLGENLDAACRSDLGTAGNMLIEWLSSVLAALDPAPPPASAFVHLLLDRYLVEARSVERHDLNARQKKTISDLCLREISDARKMLAALNAPAAIDDFSAAVKALNAVPPVAAFSSGRKLIARTLLAVATDGYTFEGVAGGSRRVDYMVRDMVENSSNLLAAAGLVG